MNERKIKKWRKSFKGISEETRLLVNDALKECYSNSEAELSWELEVRGVVLDEESMSKLSFSSFRCRGRLSSLLLIRR